MQAVLADWKTAPVREEVRATLKFLEKLTLTPGEIEAADVERVRAAGVSDDAIEDAIAVCVTFSIIDRVADAFGFEAAAAVRTITRGADSSLRYGYTKRALLHSRR